MKAIVVNGDMDIQIKKLPIPQLEDDHVLLKVSAVGICGSDVPRVLHHVCPVYPTILGHEFSGTVVSLGKKVTNIHVGQRVVGIPLVPCFECAQCKAGNYGQCEKFLFIGTKLPGAMAEYVKCPAKNLFPIPDAISDIEGAMFEPITVALHAILNAGDPRQNECTVVGCGTIGLMVIQCLRALGAAKIYAVDIAEEKLLLAQKSGADFLINTSTDSIQNHKPNSAFVFECVGANTSVATAIQAAGARAVVSLIGLPHRDVVLTPDLFDRISKLELTLKGSWMSYSSDFPGREWELAKELFLSHLIHTEIALEKILSLDDVPDLFSEWNQKGVSGKKIIIKPNC